MSTSIAHGLPGPKTNCNYFTRQFQCLFQKGDGLIFLKYFLWCWSGDATKLGYCGWGSHRRSLLLLNVLWSSNKFALRPDYSTSTPLCFSQCMVHFGRFVKNCVSTCDHTLSVLITATGLLGQKPLVNRIKWVREVGKMVLYVCDKEWLIRLGYRAHGRSCLALETAGVDSES